MEIQMFFDRVIEWLKQRLRGKQVTEEDGRDDDDFHIHENWTRIRIGSDIKVIDRPANDPALDEVVIIRPEYSPDEDYTITIPIGAILLERVDNASNPGGWYWVYYKVEKEIPKARLYYKDPTHDGPFETIHKVRCIALRVIGSINDPERDDRLPFYVADGVAPGAVPTQAEV